MNIHRISTQIWKWSLNNEKQNFGKWIKLLLDGQVRLWEKSQKWWALKAREMFVRSRRKLWPGQVLNRHAKADVPFGVDISCFQKNNDAMVVFCCWMLAHYSAVPEEINARESTGKRAADTDVGVEPPNDPIGTGGLRSGTLPLGVVTWPFIFTDGHAPRRHLHVSDCQFACN